MAYKRRFLWELKKSTPEAAKTPFVTALAGFFRSGRALTAIVKTGQSGCEWFLHTRGHQYSRGLASAPEQDALADILASRLGNKAEHLVGLGLNLRV